jgi:DNA-binding GntR family transcriptional regulator
VPASVAPPPGNRDRLTAHVADRIRNAILRGAYPAGRALREESLARRYRVSRTVLRAALRRIAEEGFVELRARQAIVTELSPAGLIELTDMLVLLEPLALRLAIPKLGGDDFARAEAALDALERENDPARAATHAWRFHAALYAPSGRPMLVDNIRRLRAQAARYRRAFAGRRRGPDPELREHRALLSLLRAGKSDEAVERLRHHISSPTSDLASLLTRVATPPAGPRATRGPRRRT